MTLAQNAVRGRLKELTEKLCAIEYCVPEIKEAAKAWMDTMWDSKSNGPAAEAYIAALENGVMTVDENIEFCGSPKAAEVFGSKEEADKML